MRRIAGLLVWMHCLQPGLAAERPNVLFLICDDLNCDMGCYGHPLVKTPNIDALAKRLLNRNRRYSRGLSGGGKHRHRRLIFAAARASPVYL